MQKVFSFDAETNGLWGEAFAIAAVVMENGKLVHQFFAYMGADRVTDDWTRENVLPALYGLEASHTSYESMLTEFAAFYLEHKNDADVVTHICVPVEAKILLDMRALDAIGDWDAPYPLIDVAGVLLAKRYCPTSVDSYNSQHCIELTEYSQHHPLYDAISTAYAYQHLMWGTLPQ